MRQTTTTTEVTQEVTEQLLEAPVTGENWFRAAAILIASIAIAIVISRVLRRLLSRGLGGGLATIITARLASYAVFLIGVSYTLTYLGVRVGPLLGALGLGGLVLALALQGVVENLVSSVILQARRPFTIGDSVTLEGHTGIVEDIDSRTTLLRSLDGYHVRIPNLSVADGVIVNLTREPARRSTMAVGVAYDTDLASAREVLLEAIGRVPRIHTEPPALVNITGFHDSSIGFNILYWHDSDVPSELATRTDLAIAVHQALFAAGITIAFPQVVVWSGSEASPIYERVEETVDTYHPGATPEETPDRRRLTGQLRRPVWWRERSDGSSSPTSPDTP